MRYNCILLTMLFVLLCLGQIAVKGIEGIEGSESVEGSDKARFGMAQSLNNLEEFDKARPMLEELHAKYPGSKKVAVELAKALGYGKTSDEETVMHAIAMLEDLEIRNPDDREIKFILAEILLNTGNYKEAKEKLIEIVEKNPQDAQASLKLAEVLADQQEFEQALSICRRVLSEEPDNKEAVLLLARFLSWDKQYDASLTLYKEIIQNYPDDVLPRREMARVLGWTRKYKEAIGVYKKALDETDAGPVVRHEMDSKYSLYNQLDLSIAGHYKKWLEYEPNHPEATFDLGQIYSRQMQWDNAKTMYNRTLKRYSEHFRAKEARERANIYAKETQACAGFEFFEADSTGRLMDKRSRTIFASVRKPLNENYYLAFRQDNIWYDFKDFERTYRQQFLIAIDYYKKPEFWASAHYAHSIYPGEQGVKNTFGGEMNYVPADLWLVSVSHLREAIIDNSAVFRDNLYRDNYKVRTSRKLSPGMTAGADYTRSHYSDDNNRDAFGADWGYYMSFGPKNVLLSYRYEQYQFGKDDPEYFTPHSFHYNSVGLEWIHFLNKQELFWGCNNTFYTLKYSINFDVHAGGNEIGHRLEAGFNHDWNKRCTSGVKLSKTIYQDNNTYAEDQFMFYTLFYF